MPQYNGGDLDREEQGQRSAGRPRAALRECRGKGEYDCLVNLSGGKTAATCVSVDPRVRAESLGLYDRYECS